MSQNIILPADASIQDASNGMGYLCEFLRHVGATTRLKIKLKLLKIPKSEKNWPPIGPGTRADHGADNAAGHPGRMRNRFRSFRCSGVCGS